MRTPLVRPIDSSRQDPPIAQARLLLPREQLAPLPAPPTHLQLPAPPVGLGDKGKAPLIEEPSLLKAPVVTIFVVMVTSTTHLIALLERYSTPHDLYM